MQHLLNGSLRYRYLSDRPANADYSLTAKGYFVNDLVLNYTKPKYEIGVTVNNLLNVRWKETQFDTETRLQHEANPIDGIAFTPGTKFAAVLHVSCFLNNALNKNLNTLIINKLHSCIQKH